MIDVVSLGNNSLINLLENAKDNKWDKNNSELTKYSVKIEMAVKLLETYLTGVRQV